MPPCIIPLSAHPVKYLTGFLQKEGRPGRGGVIRDHLETVQGKEFDQILGSRRGFMLKWGSAMVDTETLRSRLG